MEQRKESPSRQNGLVDFGYKKVRAAEKIRLVQRHFDAIARRYDFSNTVLSMGLDRVWRMEAVKTLSLRPGDSVLDLCGGTAELALLAARNVGVHGRVTLYDINRPMMIEARPKVARARLKSRINYVQGDAGNLALADRSFDAAMVGFGIRNLTDMKQGFREACRVLKHGGRFVCLEFSQPQASWFRALYNFYSFYIMPWFGQILVGSRTAYSYLPESIKLFSTPAKLAGIMEEAGFSKVSYRMLTNGIAAIHVGVKE